MQLHVVNVGNRNRRSQHARASPAHSWRVPTFADESPVASAKEAPDTSASDCVTVLASSPTVVSEKDRASAKDSTVETKRS